MPPKLWRYLAVVLLLNPRASKMGGRWEDEHLNPIERSTGERPDLSKLRFGFGQCVVYYD